MSKKFKERVAFVDAVMTERFCNKQWSFPYCLNICLEAWHFRSQQKREARDHPDEMVQFHLAVLS